MNVSIIEWLKYMSQVKITVRFYSKAQGPGLNLTHCSLVHFN